MKLRNSRLLVITMILIFGIMALNVMTGFSQTLQEANCNAAQILCGHAQAGANQACAAGYTNVCIGAMNAAGMACSYAADVCDF